LVAVYGTAQDAHKCEFLAEPTLECVRMILCEEEKNNVFSMLDGLSFSIL
jgi:hypothetical protein